MDRNNSEKKVNKVKKTMDKMKIAKFVIVILLVLMLVLSAGATLIYYMLNA